MVRTLTVLTNETDGRTRGEALPRPLPACDPVAPGRRSASPLQQNRRRHAWLSVGARHCLALFPHATLLHQGDAMRRPYNKIIAAALLTNISCGYPRSIRRRPWGDAS